MILINGNWEQIKDLSDVARIVKENISDDLAREIERICGEARKIFIEVLDIADDTLENNEYDEFIKEFDKKIGWR